MAPKKPIKTIHKPQPTPDIKKQKRQRDPNEPGLFHKLIAFFKNERTCFVFGIAVLIGVVFMLQLVWWAFGIWFHVAFFVKSQTTSKCVFLL